MTHDSRLKISLLTLTWPIWVENLLRTSFLSLDTLMLSNYSEYAVAAMSLVHTVGFFIQLLYLMVGLGANILISQHLGAGDENQAGIVSMGSVILTLLFSTTVSLCVAIGASLFIELFELEPLVRMSVVRFIQIFGGCSVFLSLNIVFSNILRSWGYSRDPMLVNIGGLLLTMVLNIIGLFGSFSFSAPGLFEGHLNTEHLVETPDLVVQGVMWVAGATVVGQAFSAGVLLILIIRRKGVYMPFHDVFRIPRAVYRKVLKVGVPSAGETLSYNLAHLVILSMIAGMGTKALAAYGISIAILRYVFITAISIGLGTQIKVGYFVGAKQYQQAYRRVLYYFALGFVFTAGLVVVTYFGVGSVSALFTEDESILALVHAVFFVAVFHEPGRTFNTIIIPALKGAGDVVFPVMMALLMMWGIGVVGSYFLGVVMDMGLVGVWIALALDEWIRGGVMLGRWRSMKWTKMRLV